MDNPPKYYLFISFGCKKNYQFFTVRSPKDLAYQTKDWTGKVCNKKEILVYYSKIMQLGNRHKMFYGLNFMFMFVAQIDIVYYITNIVQFSITLCTWCTLY